MKSINAQNIQIPISQYIDDLYNKKLNYKVTISLWTLHCIFYKNNFFVGGIPKPIDILTD